MVGDNPIGPEIARAIIENENEEIRQEAQGRVENNGVENRQEMPNVQGGYPPWGYNQGNYGNAQGKHENFSYSNPKAAVQFPPGFEPGAKPPNNEGRPSTDEMLSLIYKEMKEKDDMVDEYMKSISSQIKNMEFQIGQLATTVGNMKNKGKFPSTTESNPKEHCKAIELRNKKKNAIEQEAEDDKMSEKDEEEEIALFHEDEEKKGMMKNDKEEVKKRQKKDESAQQVPKWKLARDLKEKESDEVKCDEWGIPKI
ncbi:hypothetical protein ACS0TY_032702 [Phlomoides rotata]